MEHRGLDEQLILDFRNGDRDAFEQIYDRNYAMVLRTAHRLLGSTDAAEDVAQDVFLKLYTSPTVFNPRAKFTTWLYRVTFNACMDVLRKRSKLRDLTDVDERAGAELGPQQAIEADELARSVRAAVLAIPPRQRFALVLQHYEGLSYQQIADVLKTSVPAVESLLSRAKQSLKVSLAGAIGTNDSP